MNPDMHTLLFDTELLNATLLNMYNPMLIETFREKLREECLNDGQMEAAGEIIGLAPETLLGWNPILKKRGGFWE